MGRILEGREAGDGRQLSRDCQCQAIMQDPTQSALVDAEEVLEDQAGKELLLGKLLGLFRCESAAMLLQAVNHARQSHPAAICWSGPRRNLRPPFEYGSPCFAQFSEEPEGPQISL
jgi:hypothetical protein